MLIAKFIFLQFECCGMHNATDWTMNLKQNLSIPMSCCSHMTGAIGTSDCTANSPNMYHIGCMDAFVNFAKKHAAKIAGVGIGLGIIQVFFISYHVRVFEHCLIAYRSDRKSIRAKIFYWHKNWIIDVAACRNLLVLLLGQIDQE